MILMMLDAFCVIIAGYAAHYLRAHGSYGLWSMDDHVFAFSVMFVMFTNNLVMDKVGLYTDRRIGSKTKLAFLVFKVVVVSFSLLAAVVFLFQIWNYSRWFLVYFAVLTFVLLFIERLCASIYIDRKASRNFTARQILVVGDQSRGRCVVDALEQQLSMGHRIVGQFDLQENGGGGKAPLAEMTRLLKEREIDEVVFAVPRDRAIELTRYITVCCRMGIPSRILPSLWDPDKPVLKVEQIQGIPFLTIHVDNFNAGGLLYKRVLDFVGGLVGTCLIFLMYPFVALAIKLDSSGPVFFKQDRVGLHGRLFKLYKFRSMYTDAEERKKELMVANEMLGPMFKLKNDPRITRVGSFLRKTSLDEFPQFFNVLRGQMSLVGTRPPTVDEVKEYNLGHYKRIAAKPGITGLWQVSGRNQVCDFDEVVKLDCEYLENWHFTDDIKIILKTIYVVLARKGAA